MAKRKKPQSEYMRRKLLRKAPPKPNRVRRRKAKQNAKTASLLGLIRTAAKTGAAEAIEHCGNFWSVSDGYKKYIDHQIAAEAEALMTAVRAVVREELAASKRKRK